MSAANLVWRAPSLNRAQRESRNTYKAAVVWLTSLPGAGTLYMQMLLG